jgi:hypothetical protein
MGNSSNRRCRRTGGGSADLPPGIPRGDTQGGAARKRRLGGPVAGVQCLGLLLPWTGGRASIPDRLRAGKIHERGQHSRFYPDFCVTRRPRKIATQSIVLRSCGRPGYEGRVRSGRDRVVAKVSRGALRVWRNSAGHRSAHAAAGPANRPGRKQLARSHHAPDCSGRRSL